MKKALVSVLRLALLVGVLALLPLKGPEAQLAHQCETFQTDDIDCPSCCSTHTVFTNNILNPSSTTGIQSILNTNYSCGSTPATCNGTSCSGSYPQAVSDSGCCIASGSRPTANEPSCCPGLIVRSDGTCGTCLLTGDSGCGTASDCCASGDTCTGHVCTAPSGGSSCPYPVGSPPYCGAGNSAQWDTYTCSWTCVPSGTSPIILDIDGKGFNLTSAAGGVQFDISGTGHPIQMGWTATGAGNAFLALPGADGLVRNGQQLFGDFTPQPPSENPNGFAALAVYDLPANGGNGDGVIDSRDAIFSSLRLWTDSNHDGICQPEELHTLPSLGVNSLSLHYTLSRKVDQYGNVFRYRDAVNPDDPDASRVDRKAYDVFFVTLSSTTATLR
jgi:hypothetical protein